jgi:hypothetical protein
MVRKFCPNHRRGSLGSVELVGSWELRLALLGFAEGLARQDRELLYHRMGVGSCFASKLNYPRPSTLYPLPSTLYPRIIVLQTSP